MKPEIRGLKKLINLSISGAQMGLRMGFASGCSFFFSVLLGRTFNSGEDNYVGGLWSVISSIVVIQSHIEGSYKAAWLRFLGTLLGAIAAGLYANITSSITINLMIGLFFITLVCYIFQLFDSFRLANLTSAIVLILWAMTPEKNPWLFSFLRLVDSIIGTFFALLAIHLIFPSCVRKELDPLYIQIIEQIRSLFSSNVSYPDSWLHVNLEKLSNRIKKIEQESATDFILGSHSTRLSLHNHILKMAEIIKTIPKISSIPGFEAHKLKLLNYLDQLIMKIKNLAYESSTEELRDSFIEFKRAFAKYSKEKSNSSDSLDERSYDFIFYNAIKELTEELELVLGKT